MERLDVLVTGATGRLGGAAARQLIERGHRVRAVTRYPDGAAATRLAQLGAHVVRADLHDPESVRRAVEGADAALLVTTPARGAEAEAEGGMRALAAFAEAGVGHVVYTSVASADLGTGIPHFESKARVERQLQATPCTWTIIAPVFFRENLLAPLWRDGIQQGTLAMALPGDKALQNVEVEEVARFASRVLEDRDAYGGRRIEVASDRTTPRSMARILGRATGREIAFRRIALRTIEQQDPASAAMFRFLSEQGYHVDIRNLRRSEPEIEWRSFSAWADAQPWARLLEARM